MDIDIKPGTYVVAVSGGVDSVALLDMLVKQALKKEPAALRLIVAHYDHGIRKDSKEDRLFVQALAGSHGLPFVYDEGALGAGISEASARQARYKFLNRVKKAANAKAIITAHHQDDMIETAIINILRGTGRRGLTALKTTDVLMRPLLHLSKEQILAYAHDNKLAWHEDSTNADTHYLRNYVRHKILPRFSNEDRKLFLAHIGTLASLNSDIDKALTNHLHIHPAPDTLDRHWFIMLPHNVAKETLVNWLGSRGVNNLDKKRIELFLAAAKTLSAGKKINIDKAHSIHVDRNKLALVTSDEITANWHSRHKSASNHSVNSV